MLITSPLHQLLFYPGQDDPVPLFDMLVVTSGNRSKEPICISNQEAWDRLDKIADLILCHDRDILTRNDDSLCAIQADAPQVWRRARGYSPEAIHLGQMADREVLAMGVDLKNTIALGFRDRVILSPYMGDIDTKEALDSLETTVRFLPGFLGCRPKAVVVDLHPDMQATRVGQKLAEQQGIELVSVQHHYAHAVSCLTEHGRVSGMALVFDGTGLGTDGNIWGAEFLDINANGFDRLGTFKSVALPGGDAAILDPRRQLVARIKEAGIDFPSRIFDDLKISEEDLRIWSQMIQTGLNSPKSHGAGRLFDAFATALGLMDSKISYDGQPAVRLEACARSFIGSGESLDLLFSTSEDASGLLTVDWRDMFYMLASSWPVVDKGAWAMAFHRALARAAVEMVTHGRKMTGKKSVALTGGVFMNRLLTEILTDRLADLGFEVLLHRLVPPNDGGISLGQAVIAGRQT